MRTASDTLINELNTATEFRCCDLYRLILADTTTYYIADYDVDVTYNSHVYQHDLFMLQRNGIKISGTPTVDSLSVSIYADQSHNDLIKNTYIMKAIHDGTLDNAQLSLSRAFFSASGQLLGVINLFTGRCEISSCTSFVCKLTVKSEITGLSAQFPMRVFAPQNSYNENSNGTVVSASADEYTCAIPLKPSQNVLVKL